MDHVLLVNLDLGWSMGNAVRVWSMIAHLAMEMSIVVRLVLGIILSMVGFALIAGFRTVLVAVLLEPVGSAVLVMCSTTTEVPASSATAIVWSAHQARYAQPVQIAIKSLI